MHRIDKISEEYRIQNNIQPGNKGQYAFVRKRTTQKSPAKAPKETEASSESEQETTPRKKVRKLDFIKGTYNTSSHLISSASHPHQIYPKLLRKYQSRARVNRRPLHILNNQPIVFRMRVNGRFVMEMTVRLHGQSSPPPPRPRVRRDHFRILLRRVYRNVLDWVRVCM
jgi:hypothetical protein